MERTPRWQGHVVRPLVRRLSRRRLLSFDAMLRFEWLARLLLGQPLSLRAWHRMTFNDKVTYRRLRVRHPVFAVFSDRLAMREAVAERVGPDALPELLEVGDRAAAFSNLVGPFVLKANHGSQMVILVPSGARLSPPELVRADEWLASDYAWEDLEWGYLGARRLLLAEEFLPGPLEGAPPPDYKLFVFDGSVELVEVHFERFGAEHRIDLRLPDWTPLDSRILAPESAAPEGARAGSEGSPPANLDVMLDRAARLGEGLDFVRVDLYDVGDRVVVGELHRLSGGR